MPVIKFLQELKEAVAQMEAEKRQQDQGKGGKFYG